MKCEKRYFKRALNLLSFMCSYIYVSEFSPVRPRVICNDGFEISIQASDFHYCEPRVLIADRFGWDSYELGYPSAKEELIMEYAEDYDDPTNTVYGYVPWYVVEKVINKHGGIIGCYAHPEYGFLYLDSKQTAGKAKYIVIKENNK